jgi:hypothetical protein
MANLELSSTLLYIKCSDVDAATAEGVNGQIIVCEEVNAFSGTSNVSERKTKCGTITNTDTPTYTFSISGVAAGDLGANNVSVKQLFNWLNSNTLIYFKFANVTDGGTILAGEILDAEGTFRVSSVTITSDVGDAVVTFDAEMAVTGTVTFA